MLALIYVIGPIKKIRFYKITANRLGHFAINTELYLCQKKLYEYKNCFDIFYLDGKPCNKFFLKLVKRHLIVFPNLVTNKLFFLNNFLSNYFNFCNSHEINIKCPDRDVENLFDRYSTQLQLTSDEIINGEKYLESVGIQQKDKFVLLYVRDSNYLDKQFPDKDWSKHEYRNYDIKYFKLAVLELIRRGFYVIRIGTDVKGSLEIDSKNYIDYSLSEQRSDFLDIFLCSKCHFCLSTASGFDTIPQIFRRPIASIFVPFYLVYSWSSKILVTTKNHFSIEKKRNLTLKRII